MYVLTPYFPIFLKKNFPSTTLFFRAATQPPPTNLKDRIAALQQRSSSPPSSSPSPASTPRDGSLTPPRGSLRDKIAKFERKGGVPIPRGSFAMGAPPPEDAGSTKSRELYGNRVAALGKGRPTAPGNLGHRVVSSPGAPLASPSPRTSPDENAAKSAAHLTPNSIGQSVSFSMSLSCPSSSGVTDRLESPLNVADGSDEAQGTSVQLTASPQLEPSTGPQSSNPTSKPTASAGHCSLPVSSSSSTSIVTTVPRSDVSSTPKATSSEGTATQVGSPPTLVTHEESLARAEHCTQDYLPIVTPKSTVSTVQAHIPVEQVPAKEATISANSQGFRLARPSPNDTPTILSSHSDTSSVTQPPSSSITSPVDILKEDSTSSTSDAPILNQIKSGLPPHSSSTSASTIAFPSTISTVPSVSGDFDDSITMSSPPVPEPGRRSFSAVVHRGDGDGDNRSNSSHSTTSNSSTIIPRPSSSSSFKTGTDGGVVRSKRNFKHLGAVAADPPPSSGAGDFGAGDLAALLQEAAWLEQQLSNENMTLTVPYALGEDGQKAEKSAPSPAAATKAGQAIVPAPTVATSTRTKGRGLTLGSSISASPSNTLQSPPLTPSFQIHADALPTPPKSARGRKYFSLRGALRGPRLSVSSEMSSDDSAPVATPPSPSFDLAMQQTVQGHSNDTMSIRSMFSIRSNKSGKSDSAPGSLRLSPRHSVARASSFAERFLNRASKAKPILDDPGGLLSL